MNGVHFWYLAELSFPCTEEIIIDNGGWADVLLRLLHSTIVLVVTVEAYSSIIAEELVEICNGGCFIWFLVIGHHLLLEVLFHGLDLQLLVVELVLPFFKLNLKQDWVEFVLAAHYYIENRNHYCERGNNDRHDYSRVSVWDVILHQKQEQQVNKHLGTILGG